MTNNILHGQGFKIEQGGGGCHILSRYINGGGFVWATCLDGGGLPDASNWHVVAYGNDIDEIIYELRSDQNESGISLERSIDQALIIADTFWLENSLCRNGKPIANCDCC